MSSIRPVSSRWSTARSARNIQATLMPPRAIAGNRLTGPVRHDAFYAISHAVDGVFIWTVPAAALVFVLALAVKEIPLRGRAESSGESAAARQPEYAS